MLNINRLEKSAIPWEDLFHEWVSSMSLVFLPGAPNLFFSNRAKEEVAMNDPNLKLREFVYLKDSNTNTWQDMVRQNPDFDADPNLYKVHHESQVFPFVVSLATGLFHLMSGLLSLPFRMTHHERNDLHMERHLPAGR